MIGSSSRPAAYTLRACVLWILAACSSTELERRDWSRYDGPGADHFQREEVEFPHVDDPMEPLNRVLAAIDYGAYRFVVRPVSAVYRNFVPGDVREHLHNAGENLLYPRRLLSNLFQGEWSAAGEETTRFLVNTTLGLAGLFDPAKRMGLDPHDEDFGQTFASWGWRGSRYFFLPLYGPSTIRDAVGKIPDELADPLNYFFPWAYVRRLNRVSDEVEADLRLVEAYFDPYEPARTLYTLDREVGLRNFSWRRDESAATQTLDSIFLTFEDPEFPLRRTLGRPGANEVGRVPPYSYWLQREPSPLVYIVPGLGGHRAGNSALGLAEIVFQRGNSVVVVSNPTNFEFIEHASSVELPGYVPVDARDLHRALTAIDSEMSRRHPGAFTSKRLAGISMGAFQTLFIAANEAQAVRDGLVPFDVYLAMDVPVSLEHAITQLDRFYNAPLEFPAAARKQKIEEILAKVLYLTEGDLTPAAELPFTQLESQFLIGLAFRMDLQFVIVQTQERRDMGVLRTKSSWWTRAPVFREASEYSYMEYVYGFLLPYYATRDDELTFDEAGARALFERCDLHSVAEGLRANDKVRVFANENDFLLRPEDREWLRELLGERAHFFPAGGHLGNLHRKTIQEIIQGTMERAADDPSG